MKAKTLKLETPEHGKEIISHVRQSYITAVKSKEKIEVVIQNQKTKAEIREKLLNRLLWHWNGEIAEQSETHGLLLNEIHEQNKLDIGVPILLKNEKFSEVWEVLRHLTREQKLKLMNEKSKCYIPITSIMNNKEMSEYLSTMRIMWQNQGIRLTDKNDMMQEALGRSKAR